MPSDSTDPSLSSLEARLARLRPKPPNPPLAPLLSSLSPPNSPPTSIPISTKNPPPDIDAYLSSFPTPSSPTDRRLNAALASYEALVPAFTPIEVSFHAPAGVERTEEEEEELIKRMRDELSVEREVEGSEEGGMGELERRFEALKGFEVVGSGRGQGEEGMGAPPRAVELEEFEREGSGSDADSAESKDEVSEESKDSEEEEEDDRD